MSKAERWRTPNTGDERPGPPDTQGQVMLANQAALWPTPSAALMNDDESPATFRARQDLLRQRGINGNGSGTPLTITAKEVGADLFWPTPASRDHRSPNSQDSQDRRNADSARGQQLPNFVEHLFLAPSVAHSQPAPPAWVTPSTMDARGRTYTRDGGKNGEERAALAGQAETFVSSPSTRPDPASASDGPPSSPTSPSSLRLSPEFVEWLMGWPPGWTIPDSGALRREPTVYAPPATAWCHWLQRQRSWLCGLSWIYVPPPGVEPEPMQMSLL